MTTSNDTMVTMTDDVCPLWIEVRKLDRGGFEAAVLSDDGCHSVAIEKSAALAMRSVSRNFRGQLPVRKAA